MIPTVQRNRIWDALTWRPKTWKQRVAALVALCVFIAAFTFMVDWLQPHHSTPKPPVAPTAQVQEPVHQATLMAQYGLPGDWEQHCQVVYITVQCYLVGQHDSVEWLAWQLGKNQSIAEVNAAIAAICFFVTVLAGAAAGLICAASILIDIGHSRDQINFANAVNEDACIEIHYVSFPVLTILPGSVNYKGQDGGWCYDGFPARVPGGVCEYYLGVVNGWDTYFLVDEQDYSRCPIV